MVKPVSSYRAFYAGHDEDLTGPLELTFRVQ